MNDPLEVPTRIVKETIMTPAEFKSQIRALGLTQTDAATICKPNADAAPVSARAVRNWCAGVARIPQYAVDAIEQARDVAGQAIKEGRQSAAEVLPIVLHRTDEAFWAADPGKAPYPVSFWEVVAAHIQNGRASGTTSIDYVDVTP